MKHSLCQGTTSVVPLAVCKLIGALAPGCTFAAILGLTFSLITGSATAQEHSTDKCHSPDKLSIVRVDDDSKRIFVEARMKDIATATTARKTLIALQGSLEQCRPNWRNAWSVSFFSDRSYANYKTEIAPDELSSKWVRAYIGEYDRNAAMLKLNPLDSRKIRVLRVALP